MILDLKVLGDCSTAGVLSELVYVVCELKVVRKTLSSIQLLMPFSDVVWESQILSRTFQ